MGKIKNEKEFKTNFQIMIYPGVLLGIRSYHHEDFTAHVLYLPLIFFSLIINKEEEEKEK
jgi:hypothetical protein